MLLKSGNFSLQVTVSVDYARVAELNIIELLSDDDHLVVSASVFALKFKQQSTQFSVLLKFNVSLSQKSRFFFVISIEYSLLTEIIALKSLGIILQSS